MLYLLAIIQAVPSTNPDTNIVGWFLSMCQWIVTQFQNHNYAPAIAAVVMILVFIFRQLAKGKIDPKHLPLVSALVGTITATATSLLGIAVGSSTKDVLEMLGSGLITGAAASGLFDVLRSSVLPTIAKVRFIGPIATFLLNILSTRPDGEIAAQAQAELPVTPVLPQPMPSPDPKPGA